ARTFGRAAARPWLRAAEVRRSEPLIPALVTRPTSPTLAKAATRPGLTCRECLSPPPHEGGREMPQADSDGRCRTQRTLVTTTPVLRTKERPLSQLRRVFSERVGHDARSAIPEATDRPPRHLFRETALCVRGRDDRL